MNLSTITPEELVDGFMIPAQLNPEQKRQADRELAIIRQKRTAERSEQETVYGQLLQLKIQIEEYIKQDAFDPRKNFAYFLRAYIELQPKKKRDVAAELDIHKTKLSQLLSGHRKPAEDLFIRLEFHSKQLIPARYWLRLSMKQQEHTITTNATLRNAQKKHVTGHLAVDF